MSTITVTPSHTQAIPPSARQLRAPATRRVTRPSLKAREAGIYTNGRLRTRAAARSASPASADSDGAEPAQGRDADTLTRLTQTITELKECVKQQNASIIEVHGELGRVRTEQELLKCQNAELQEEIRALRTQVGALSVSAPSTRSWASVAAITDASQLSSRSNISLARTADSTGTKTEQNVVRISTQAEQSAAGSSDATFTRYLSTDTANRHIREALRETEATSEVSVVGVGTTKTGYVIRFKNEASAGKAKANAGWLEKLGNGTKLVKPKFGVVVHRFPTQGISLPSDEARVIDAIIEENEFATRKYSIDSVAWLKHKDKTLGSSASLGVWFDTAEAAEWAIRNGIVYQQRYIGSVEAYRVEKKRCHRCQSFGHLAWSCKEKRKCRHCSGEHDRMDCEAGTAARCADCDGPHPLGAVECNGPPGHKSL